MKYWRPDKPFQTVMQQRHVVRIGAVMRPFGEIVNIEMHLDPSFCLRTVTGFLTKLQSHVQDNS